MTQGNILNNHMLNVLQAENRTLDLTFRTNVDNECNFGDAEYQLGKVIFKAHDRPGNFCNHRKGSGVDCKRTKNVAQV